MARPSRCRRICLEPEYDSFVPCGIREPEVVILNIDEFEAIRLIDYEKRTHEQCAAQMGISRTTATEIYQRARSKIADCLMNGKALHISGGNYKLCDGSAWKCCGKKCNRINHISNQNSGIRKETDIMKIAVTYENGTIFQHFGHTEQFKVYDIADGKVADAKVVSTQGSGHGALAALLSDLKVDTLICGGIGAGAQNALAEAGISLYGGVTGNADDAVDALLAGNLVYNPNVHCSHHGHHGEGHQCGEHKHGCRGNA